MAHFGLANAPGPTPEEYAEAPLVIIEPAVPPKPVVAIDPGTDTVGLAFFDTVAPSKEPRRFSLAWWGQRQQAKREEQRRDQMSIYEWAGFPDVDMEYTDPDKATIDRIAEIGKRVWVEQVPLQEVITESELDKVALSNVPGYYDPTPISSARSTRRQVETLQTIDVDEVFWDLASMIDAHRNGATALERPLGPTEGLVGETPVWEDVSARLYDPTHEMGPRERAYIRKQWKEDKKKK